MDDRFNTIAGWVLFAGIVALGSSIVAGEAFHSERPETMGYPIEGVAQEGGEGAEAEQPIAVYLASADPAKGEQLFKKCASCHSADKGGGNKVGPNLYGVVGSPKARIAGFNYSGPMKSKGGDWSYDELNAFIQNPKAHIPGTIMAFAGIPQAGERADLLTYMRTLNDTPPPLSTP